MKAIEKPKTEKFIKITFDGDLMRIQKENVSNIEYWKRKKSTRAYLSALIKRLNSNTEFLRVSEDQLVIAKQGNPESGGGAWIQNISERFLSY